MTYTDVAFDNDTRRYLELGDLLDSIVSEMSAIKERFRVLGKGTHESPSGVVVTVTAPNRSFNLPKATEMLSAEQLALCKQDGYDPKKVRRFLSPALLEMCMDPGTGELRVSVK